MCMCLIFPIGDMLHGVNNFATDIILRDITMKWRGGKSRETGKQEDLREKMVSSPFPF